MGLQLAQGIRKSHKTHLYRSVIKKNPLICICLVSTAIAGFGFKSEMGVA